MSEGKDSLDLSGLGAALPNAADLSAEDKANLVASIKNTLEGLALRHMDVLENLEPKVRKRVEKLREIQEPLFNLVSLFASSVHSLIVLMRVEIEILEKRQ